MKTFLTIVAAWVSTVAALALAAYWLYSWTRMWN